MANLTDALKDAMLQYSPALEADYKNYVRSSFDRMVADLGPGLKNVYNDHRWARTFRGVVRSNVRNEPGGTLLEPTPYRLDSETLNKNAKRYAEDVSLAWFGKMKSKLGDISDVTVTPPDSSGNLVITGKHDGDSIRVSQRPILNVSPLGTPFHQWPALIYINNKKKSEVEYKKIAVSWGVKSLAEDKPKRPAIDIDSRPKEYYFEFMASYFNQPDRAPEKRREGAKGMSPDEAQAKIVNNHKGWGMRLFGFKLSAVYAWNGRPLWQAASGEPSPVGDDFPDMTFDRAVEVVRSTRKKPAARKSVSHQSNVAVVRGVRR